MNIQNKKQLKILTFALIMVVVLGIGYAGITAINLVINGEATASVDQNNFKVKFLSEENVTPTITGGENNTVEVVDDLTAKFSANTLTAEGDSEVATFRVRNDSKGIGAKIKLGLTNTNTDYFKVTEYIADSELQAGDETTVTVTVEMLKTPVESEVSTTITATLEATAVENEAATGGDSKEEIRPIPYTYTHHAYDGTYVTIGQPFSNGERTYSNFAASKNDFGHPASLAHRVSSDNILESYVVFEKDNKLYYLRGGAGNENELAEKPIYTNNVNTLKEAFGPDWESVCSEYSCGENCVLFHCSADGLSSDAYADGIVRASGSGWYCDVNVAGGAACRC